MRTLTDAYFRGFVLSWMRTSYVPMPKFYPMPIPMPILTLGPDADSDADTGPIPILKLNSLGKYSQVVRYRIF